MALLPIAAYLLGAIPFAQLIARAHGIDLREVHTGNVGAGNLSRQLGLKWGLVAAALDCAKGFLPAFVALDLGMGPGAAGMIGIAAVIGHNWSIFMKGRSGRGLATSAGLLLAIDPILLIWVGVWAIGGWWMRGGIAGFMGWGLLPAVAVMLSRPPTETVMLLLLSVILMARRAQGNPDSERGFRPALQRILFDLDKVVDSLPITVDDPLQP
jgi:acyl phosphate:glycerol-3-phosphate acyltransferase